MNYRIMFISLVIALSGACSPLLAAIKYYKDGKCITEAEYKQAKIELDNYDRRLEEECMKDPEYAAIQWKARKAEFLNYALFGIRLEKFLNESTFLWYSQQEIKHRIAATSMAHQAPLFELETKKKWGRTHERHFNMYGNKRTYNYIQQKEAEYNKNEEYKNIQRELTEAKEIILGRRQGTVDYNRLKMLKDNKQAIQKKLDKDMSVISSLSFEGLFPENQFRKLLFGLGIIGGVGIGILAGYLAIKKAIEYHNQHKKQKQKTTFIQ